MDIETVRHPKFVSLVTEMTSITVERTGGPSSRPSEKTETPTS